MKSFEQWKTQELERTFGIRKVEQLPVLEAWISTELTLLEKEKTEIEAARCRIKEFVDDFNESDLKFYFIGQLMVLAEFLNGKYRGFTEQKLSVTRPDQNGKEVELRGRMEFVVALGRQLPEKPYFFLNEYKPEQRGGNDPKGQLLSTMLAAQVVNGNKKPVFGAYVTGRNWFFVVLEGDEYAISPAFDCTEQPIFRIFAILKQCGLYIKERIALETL